MGEGWRLSPQAREYGARELVRRACGADVAESSDIDVGPSETRMRILGPGGALLRFPHTPEGSLGPGFVTRFAWPPVPEGLRTGMIGDFVAPHLRNGARPSTPLFRVERGTDVVASGDLPASVVATLSRLEETEPGKRDKHQRFPTEKSLASRHGFLERPVIDELAYGLEACIREALPRWRRAPRRLRARISHDVDVVGVPFGKRLALEFTTVGRRPLATLREVCSALGLVLPCYLSRLEELVRLVRSTGLDSSVYWMAARPTDRDSGYDLTHRLVRSALERCYRAGAETGYHASYYCLDSPELIRKEVEQLRTVTGHSIVGGRHHYLRWSPEMWHHWERAGLLYDSSVGYADSIGFRAGTCVPYRPWSLRENRVHDLVELPLIVMDGTLTTYMNLSAEEAVERVRRLIERCRLADGVFTLLWHNTSVGDAAYAGLLDPILDKLRGADSYGHIVLASS